MKQKTTKAKAGPPAASRAPKTASVGGGADYAIGSDIRQVRFAHILDEAEANWAGFATPTEAAKILKRSALRAIARLRPFWSELRVGDIENPGNWDADLQSRADARSLVDRWFEWRTSQPVLLSNGQTPPTHDEEGHPLPLRKVTIGTAISEMNRLRSYINAFKAEHGLVGNVDFNIPTTNVGGDIEWFERDEVARILWAVRGRKWNRYTQSWETGEDGRRLCEPLRLLDPTLGRRWDQATERWIEQPLRRWDRRRQRWIEKSGHRWDETSRRWVADPNAGCRQTRQNALEWISRMVIFLIYTGTTHGCAKELSWFAMPEGNVSYVDLDNEIEGRLGHLFRIGQGLPAVNMRGIPVAMSRRLTAHLRRWRQLDAAHGFTRMIHSGANDRRSRIAPSRPMGGNSSLMGEICKRAGLDDTNLVAKLRCTAVAMVLRSGQRRFNRKFGKAVPRFKPPRAIMRSAAFMVGSNYRSFVEKYESIAPDFQRRQLRALHSLAPTIRG